MSLDVKNVTVSPTVTAGAYSANDCVGGLFKFKGANFFHSGYVHSLNVFDDASQEVALDLILFSAKPSSSTITDNAAIVIHANDIDKVIGTISVYTTSWISLSGSSIAFVGQQSIPYVANNSELYATLKTTGTPTFGATTDLTLNLGIFRDEN